MSTHDIKIRTEWLARVVSGEKRAEIRLHDRDYQVGDVLHMTEVDKHGYPVTYPTDGTKEGPDVGHLTVDAFITHVLDGRQADGIHDGYCLLSIEVTS